MRKEKINVIDNIKNNTFLTKSTAPRVPSQNKLNFTTHCNAIFTKQKERHISSKKKTSFPRVRPFELFQIAFNSAHFLYQHSSHISSEITIGKRIFQWL